MYSVIVVGETRAITRPVCAIEGVIAPGRRVDVFVYRDPSQWRPRFDERHGDWRPARVVPSWDHGYGSIICLQWEAPEPRGSH